MGRGSWFDLSFEALGHQQPGAAPPPPPPHHPPAPYLLTLLLFPACLDSSLTCLLVCPSLSLPLSASPSLSLSLSLTHTHTHTLTLTDKPSMRVLLFLSRSVHFYFALRVFVALYPVAGWPLSLHAAWQVGTHTHTHTHTHLCLACTKLEEHPVSGGRGADSSRAPGIGIPQDKLEEIFAPYEQLDMSKARMHGGVGLGLTLAKQLVEAHNGTITAFSAGLKRGSCFTVVIPLEGSEKSLSGSSRVPIQDWVSEVATTHAAAVHPSAAGWSRKGASQAWPPFPALLLLDQRHVCRPACLQADMRPAGGLDPSRVGAAWSALPIPVAICFFAFLPSPAQRLV